MDSQKLLLVLRKHSYYYFSSMSFSCSLSAPLLFFFWVYVSSARSSYIFPCTIPTTSYIYIYISIYVVLVRTPYFSIATFSSHYLVLNFRRKHKRLRETRSFSGSKWRWRKWRQKLTKSIRLLLALIIISVHSCCYKLSLASPCFPLPPILRCFPAGERSEWNNAWRTQQAKRGCSKRCSKVQAAAAIVRTSKGVLCGSPHFISFTVRGDLSALSLVSAVKLVRYITFANAMN